MKGGEGGTRRANPLSQGGEGETGEEGETGQTSRSS